MTPTEVKKWPAYLTEKVEPATTMHFVAFIVDKAGKYGPLAKVELSSQELVYADIAWVEPFTTNLVDGTLKNKTTFEFTPATEGEAASYKYVWQSTKYYNYYEGLDDVQMANEIFFSTSAETVTAEELVDGKILIEDHSYGDTYYFAVIPIDADGAPGSSAAIFEYSCDFALENVATEGAEFDATMPEIAAGNTTLMATSNLVEPSPRAASRMEFGTELIASSDIEVIIGKIIIPTTIPGLNALKIFKVGINCCKTGVTNVNAKNP